MLVKRVPNCITTYRCTVCFQQSSKLFILLADGHRIHENSSSSAGSAQTFRGSGRRSGGPKANRLTSLDGLLSPRPSCTGRGSRRSRPPCTARLWPAGEQRSAPGPWRARTPPASPRTPPWPWTAWTAAPWTAGDADWWTGPGLCGRPATWRWTQWYGASLGSWRSWGVAASTVSWDEVGVGGELGAPFSTTIACVNQRAEPLAYSKGSRPQVKMPSSSFPSDESSYMIWRHSYGIPVAPSQCWFRRLATAMCQKLFPELRIYDQSSWVMFVFHRLLPTF